MDKTEIAAYFDRCAPQWDADMVKNEALVARILDNAGVGAGKRVLDVACGTGVLLPDYLGRGVLSVTGIDISPAMIEIAKKKFPHDNVRFLCGDAETAVFPEKFDCIVVYNAFPHFPEPARLVQRLTGLLAPGGTLTVAHGMSRARIDRHHHGSAARVSVGLMEAEDLAALFRRGLRVTVVISDETMYQVSGVLDQ